MAGIRYDYKDFEGEKFGEWEVIGYKRDSHFKLLCKNEEGVTKYIRSYKLLKEFEGKFKNYNLSKIKHGLRTHPLYGRWDAIKQRCKNKKNVAYKNYGGRGILICDEWSDNPQKFIEWSLNNGWEKGLEIDRIDNDGNYEPSNCRFVTHTENNHNTRLITSQNTSGYRGVHSLKTGRYQIIIQHNKRKVLTRVGFYNPMCAAIFRDKYVIQNNLPHMLNFPKLRDKYGDNNE